MSKYISTKERRITTREKQVNVVGSKSSSAENVSHSTNMQNDPSWYGGDGKEQKPHKSSWFGNIKEDNIDKIKNEVFDMLS